MKTATKKELRITLANLLHATNNVKFVKGDALDKARYDAQTALWKGNIPLHDTVVHGTTETQTELPESEPDSTDTDNDKDIENPEPNDSIPFLQTKRKS